MENYIMHILPVAVKFEAVARATAISADLFWTGSCLSSLTLNSAVKIQAASFLLPTFVFVSDWHWQTDNEIVFHFPSNRITKHSELEGTYKSHQVHQVQLLSPHSSTQNSNQLYLYFSKTTKTMPFNWLAIYTEGILACWRVMHIGEHPQMLSLHFESSMIEC